MDALDLDQHGLCLSLGRLFAKRQIEDLNPEKTHCVHIDLMRPDVSGDHIVEVEATGCGVLSWMDRIHQAAVRDRALAPPADSAWHLLAARIGPDKLGRVVRIGLIEIGRPHRGKAVFGREGTHAGHFVATTPRRSRPHRSIAQRLFMPGDA